MRKFKFSRKLLPVILSLMMIVSSLPISNVYAATKETIDCSICNGTGQVDCADCTNGHTNEDCDICLGKGFITSDCPDCENGLDNEGNPCSKCSGLGTIENDCNDCNATGKKTCSVCQGVGTIKCTTCDGKGKVDVEYEKCPDCNGKGACTTCEGKGETIENCPDCTDGTVIVACSNCENGKISAVCDACNGSKKIDCIKCTASGELTCGNCNATGTLENGDMCSDCFGSGKVGCDICSGSGKVNCIDCNATGNVEKKCSICNGSGEITENCSTCNGDKTITVECNQCNGSKKCSKCSGTGKIETKFDESFKFDNMNPSPIKVGDILENAATSKSNTTGKITYAVDNSDIAAIDDKGNLTALSVGTVVVTASIETDYEYSSNEIKYSITIEKATPIIEIESVSEITYGQKLSDSTINAVAKVGNNTVNGIFKWANPDEKPTVIENSEKTEYEIKFTPNDSKNYTESTGVTKIKVNPSDISGITVTGNTYDFTGESYDSVTVDGTVEGDKIEYSVDGENYSESIPQITNVSDTKTIFVKVTRNGNYNEFNTSATATINPSGHDGITFNFEGGAYNGKAYKVEVSGAVGELTYTYNGKTSTESPEFTDVGEYEITVNLPSNNGKPNYKPETYKGKLVISPADLTITAKDVEKTYNDEVFTSNEVNTEGLIEGQSLKSVSVDGSGKTVGTYNLIPGNAKIADAKGTDVTDNYTISYKTGTLSIIKKDVTVTPESINVKYNAKSYSGNGYDIKGLVDGHKETVAISGTATEVGTYKDALSISSISILNGEEDVTNNYEITKNTADIVISYLEIDNLEDTYEYSLADGKNVWYQSKAVIKAKDGYEISYQNKNSDDFLPSLEYTTEGVNKPKIAIKELSTGCITDIVSLGEIKIDTKNPAVYDIEYLTPVAYKILEGITFGVYDAPTTVKIKASDENSGISSISYKCGDQETVTVDKQNLIKEDDNTYSFIINVPEKFEGQISYFAEDVSGRKSDIKSDENGIIVDTTDPVITSVVYNTSINTNGKYYYPNDVKLEFSVNEKYFYENYLNQDKRLVNSIENNISVALETIDGNKSIVPEKTFDEINKKIIVKIPAENNDGDYIVKLSYKDPAGNKSNAFSTETIVIDTTAPEVSIKYDNNKIFENALDNTYFNANRTATITVTEHNFAPGYLENNISIIANDILTAQDTDMGIRTKVAEQLKDILVYDNWTHNGNVHTFALEYVDDAIYDFALTSFKDYALNEMNPENDNKVVYAENTVSPENFVVDKVAPSDVEITYSESVLDKMLGGLSFGFYQGNCKVTLTTTDMTSGVQYFDYSYDVNTANEGKTVEKAEVTSREGSTYKCEFEIPAQFRGQVTATATDNSGNTSNKITDGKNIVVDNIAPGISVSYPAPANSNAGIDYYADDVTVTVTVDEENFMDGEYPTEVKDMKISAVIEDDQENKTTETYEVEEWNRVDNTDKWEGTFVLETEGDYTLTIDYKDKSDNKANTYTRESLTIDKTNPIVTIGYDNNKVSENALDNTYFNANRTATITVTEHNFAPEYFENNISIIANDILTAQDADMGIRTKVAEQLKDILEYDNWNHNGNVHTFDLEYVDDAIFDFALTSFKDYALNEMNPENENKVVYAEGTVSPEHFAVDTTLPTDVEITYSEKYTVLETISKSIFWFFNPLKDDENMGKCTVTLSTTDMTSGVQYFDYSYDVNDDVNTANEGKKVEKAKVTSREGSTYKCEFEIPAQFRGKVTATATDNSGNTSNKITDGKNIVVDNIAPGISVSYPTPANSQKDNPNKTNYYSEDVTVTVTVKEENFMDGEFPDDVRDMKINALIEDENRNVIEKTYKIDNWERVNNTDEWKGTFILKDEGDYTLSISYADKSGNEVFYSNSAYPITIDKTAPIVKVDFDSIKPVHTIDGREYYNTNRSATITVTEHNFYPEYFETENILKAQNILGDEVTNYIEYFKDEKNWTTDSTGNVHTIKVDFKSDANYTFDFEFEDLAKNEFVYEESSNNRLDDYPSYLFTVDKTAPKNLKVSYSTNVFETVINAISFGYYDSKMTVTISADDDTTGVYHFMYSYLTAKGVSDVNAQLINDAIGRAKITRNGKTSTASFSIPKSSLTRNSQFNGTVEFTAYDYAENNTYKAETKRVVVDNISPTSTITFNEPVQNANNISYYAGNIDATISINEANFYSQDVDVIVTKDGSRYPVSVNWTDNSVDSHTGTFRLTEDGDYVVRVVYSDRSGNAMATYESNQLTIDTVDPVITVSGLNHQSANNGETIGFSISVTDKNIALSEFKPVLTAVIRNDNGELETINISLGDPVTSTNEKGETVYTYTVQNLSVDGFYSLTCGAVDYANHSVNLINSGQDNGSSANEEMMNFSVNREGSTFWIETTHNDKYTDKIFNNELDKAYANDNVEIVIHELNVDQVNISNNRDERTVFALHDGSSTGYVTLQEGSGANGNYVKNTLRGEGGWYETRYTLNNDNFAHDGVYSFSILSYDRAGNSNLNTKDDSGIIKFTVDRTNPVITSNISENQVIDADSYTVEFEINDTNHDKDSVEVTLNGKPIPNESITSLGGNSYSFEMSTGSKQSVSVTSKDLAGNTAEQYEINDVTVSTNRFVLFYYSHTLLFWIIIAGIVLLACLILFIVFRRKKDDDDEEEK